MGRSTELVIQWFERVWNQGDASYIDEGLCEPCDMVGLTPEPIRSRADFHAFHGMFNDVLENIRVVPEQLTENGDTFAGIVVVNATHRVSGKPVEFKSSFIGTFNNGQIQSGRNLVDYLGILIQVGALPDDTLEKGLMGDDASDAAALR